MKLHVPSVTSAMLALVAASGPAQAAEPAGEYPSKPVHVVVVFPPGGSNDVTAAYKGGGPLGTALISGEVATTIGTIGSFFSYIKSGQMRPLGVTSARRVDRFPDIPAIAETVPGYEFTAWVGSFLPAKTPRRIVEKLNVELKKAVNDPEVVKLFTNRVLDPMYMTPDKFAQRLKSDYDRYGKLMKVIGVV